MLIYKRTIDSEISAETHGYGNQASLNSDGKITIRSFIKGLDGEDKEEAILVLNSGETSAIIELMKRIGKCTKNYLIAE